MSSFNETGKAGLGCFLLMVAAAAFWGGGQACYTAVRYREPLPLTMAEYLRAKPDAAWLELREAVVYIPGAGHLYRITSSKEAPADEVFIPLYDHVPVGQDEPSHVLLATRDPAILALYNGFRAAKTEAQAEEHVKRNLDRLFAKRTVRGLVRFGIDLDSRDQEKLRAAANLKSDDFVIIDEGKEPSTGLGFGMFVVAVVAVSLGIWRLSRAVAETPPSE